MIGIDIISINRFKKLKEGDHENWEKFFTAEEWQYCFREANFFEHLAGIFAAKEAAIKACEKKKVNNLSQIEIKHSENGQPVVIIKGNPELKINVSISHDKESAIAVALIK